MARSAQGVRMTEDDMVFVDLDNKFPGAYVVIGARVTFSVDPDEFRGNTRWQGNAVDYTNGKLLVLSVKNDYTKFFNRRIPLEHVTVHED